MLAAPGLELREGVEQFLERDGSRELLRFTTAGSVDDGKSTLIGRLLHDSKAVYEDQLASVKKSRVNRSGRSIDFSLLTDGLRAEREQGITIDVAYRYFSTPRRKFIIADTPGHEQYTRNMATGASTADLAVILIDATKGVLPQTRRHAYIASLLGIPSVLAAVNKMDLVGYREDVFLELQSEFLALAERLGVAAVQCIPISALDGDNVVTRSKRTPWYSGPALLEHLETLAMRPAVEMNALRFPIQYVIRPDASFRGFAGRIASGHVRPGDAVIALPSGQKTRVQSIVTRDGELSDAIPGQSVVLKLEKEIDLSRGDMLVSPESRPAVSSQFAATVVWLHSKPLELHKTYLAKHAGRQVKARATRIRFRVDVNALTEHAASELEMNGIAEVEFETSSPLFFDPYVHNRTTGSFILIAPLSNATVGAAMIREDLSQSEAPPQEKETGAAAEVAEGIRSEERMRRRGHRPAIIWTRRGRAFAASLERFLFEKGFEAFLVDASQIPQEGLLPLLAALWSAGLLIVYSDDSGEATRTDRNALQTIAAEDLYDLSAANSSNSDREILDQALAMAESLREGLNSNHREEVY